MEHAQGQIPEGWVLTTVSPRSENSKKLEPLHHQAAVRQALADKVDSVSHAVHGQQPRCSIVCPPTFCSPTITKQAGVGVWGWAPWGSNYPFNR
eukprot:scaffold123107_cov15-Tisochrysis_lutea.AAC.1